MSIPLYKRMDVPQDRYSSLEVHISGGNPPVFILKQSGRQVYYVVDDDAWWTACADLSGLAMSMDDLAELALHQTAERFDTLEQAMLYFAATT